jgi:hypothetical protein
MVHDHSALNVGTIDYNQFNSLPAHVIISLGIDTLHYPTTQESKI